MKKVRKLFAVLLSLALIFAVVPFSGLVASALDVTDTRLVTYVEGSNTEGNVYNPGGQGTGTTWTFSGTQDGWRNNFYSYYHNSSEAAVDFTGCTHITMTLENITTTTDGFTAQEAWQYWLGHMYVVIKSNGNWSRFPLPAIKAGETSVTVEVDLAMLSGFTISSVQRIGIKTVRKGDSWRSDGNMNTSLQTNFNYGYTDSNAPVLKFHPCKIYGIQRTRTDTATEKFVRRGFYKFWGNGASNIAWCSTELTLDPVDISSYDYLEFDVYISDVERLIAEVDSNGRYWYSFRIRLGTSSSNYYTAALDKANAVSGYNHVKVPISNLASKASAFSYINFYQENNSFLYVSGGASNYVFGVDNFVATKDPANIIPEINNTYTTKDSIEGVQHTMTLAAGENPFSSGKHFFKLSKTLDTSDADTIEMDIYASADTDNSPSFWVSSNRESGSPRGKYSVPLLTAGWNHVVIDASKTDGTSGSGYSFQGYEFKFPFFESAFYTSAHPTGGTIKVANLSVTRNPINVIPEVNNTYVTVDSLAGTNHTMTLAPGENPYPNKGYFKFSRSLNTSDADYIEMDIYASADMDRAPTIWVSNDREAGNPRGRYDIPQLTAGWHHVVIDATKVISTLGAYTFKGYNFKYPFFESVFFSSSHPTGGTVRVANISTTRNAYNEVSVSTEGSVGSNFYLAVENYADPATATVKFTHGTEVVTHDVADYSANENHQYMFTFDVCPAEINDSITVQILDDEDQVVYERNDYSVAGYLNSVVDMYEAGTPITDSVKDPDGSKLNNLCKALLNYSANSQVQLGYNAATGAANVDNTFGGTEFTANDVYKPANVYGIEDLKFRGMSFLVEANSAVRFYVRDLTLEELNEFNFNLVLDAVDVNGQALLAPTGMAYRTGSNANGAYVEVYGIESANMNYTFTLEISDGVNETSLTVSALSYVRAVMRSTATEELTNLCKAMYQYSVASEAYFQGE